MDRIGINSMTLKLQEHAVVRLPGNTAERAGLPRVLYAVLMDPSGKFGSIEEQIVILASRFQDEGGLFLPLFITDQTDVAQFHKHGVQPVCLQLRRFSWRTLWQLRRIVREQKIEIIHWNFMPSLANAYVWALSLL